MRFTEIFEIPMLIGGGPSFVRDFAPGEKLQFTRPNLDQAWLRCSTGTLSKLTVVGFGQVQRTKTATAFFITITGECNARHV
jgi:hypothetical protein